MYISDPSNCVIRKVAAGTGVITTVAGTGMYGFSGDHGPAGSAQLSYPRGVAVDAAGNLYISDTDNLRIREVSAKTGNITTVAGNGQYGYAGDGGLAINATMSYPEGIASDSAGNLYFADTNNNIVRKINASNGIISTVAAPLPLKEAMAAKAAIAGTAD